MSAPKTTLSSVKTGDGNFAEHSADGQDQPWRAQLKEKVRQARERKTGGLTGPGIEPDEAELDPNPLVESALKRIQWAKHTPPAATAPRVVRHGSRAMALAAEEDYESDVFTEPESKSPPQPEARPQPRLDSAAESKTAPNPGVRVSPVSNNPMLARRAATQPVSQPETKPLPARPVAMPDGTLAMPQAESRIEIRPAVATETIPASESRIPETRSRVTGEIKITDTPPAAKPQPEKAMPADAPTLHTPVATEVVGLPRRTGSLKYAQPEPAKLWVRTLAGACDFVIMEMAFLPLFYSYATLNTSPNRESFAILFFLLATLTFCYQFLMLTVAGRTTGMACLNLKLVNVVGKDRPISGTQKFARAVAATAAFLLPPLNLIVMQSNHQRYTLPDLLSGTTLVDK
ncbi:MAG: RDD family protein [Acidobacteriota bacterium]